MLACVKWKVKAESIFPLVSSPLGTTAHRSSRNSPGKKGFMRFMIPFYFFVRDMCAI